MRSHAAIVTMVFLLIAGCTTKEVQVGFQSPTEIYTAGRATKGFGNEYQWERLSYVGSTDSVNSQITFNIRSFQTGQMDVIGVQDDRFVALSIYSPTVAEIFAANGRSGRVETDSVIFFRDEDFLQSKNIAALKGSDPTLGMQKLEVMLSIGYPSYEGPRITEMNGITVESWRKGDTYFVFYNDVLEQMTHYGTAPY